MGSWDRVTVDREADSVWVVLDDGMRPAPVYMIEADGTVALMAHEDPKTGANRDWNNPKEVVIVDAATAANVRGVAREILSRNEALRSIFSPTIVARRWGRAVSYRQGMVTYGATDQSRPHPARGVH